jgi:HTH-type transcriptional regulator / antitoxin HigA
MLNILAYVRLTNNMTSDYIKTRGMETLKYKIIKTEEQYWEYCNILEELVSKKQNNEFEDEIEMLTVLIEKWDDEHSALDEADPVELLKFLMAENKLKAKDLASILDISKSTVSEILHYRKGFSKEIIRKLAERFKLKQEAFNRPYQILSTANGNLKDISDLDITKKLAASH